MSAPASDELLEAVLDATRGVIIVVDRAGKVLRLNRAAAEALGRDAKDGACPVWDLLAVPEQKAALREALARSADGVPSELTVHLAGRHRRVELTVKPVRRGRGEPVTVITGIDVAARLEAESCLGFTERSAAEAALRESEGRLRRLVEANVVGVVVWDLDGRILEANQAFLDLVGYDRDDLLSGRVSSWDLTAPEYRERDRQALAELEATGRCHPFEKAYIARDGTSVPVIVAAAAIGDHASADRSVALVIDMRGQAHLRSELEESLAHARIARRETEEANVRLLLVADAGRVLARSLRADDTLKALPRLFVPALGDWCLVVRREGDAAVGRHADPDKEGEIARLSGLRWRHESVARAFRTGDVAICAQITDDELSEDASPGSLLTDADPEAARIVRALGMRSLLCVPIKVRGRVDAVAMIVSSTNPERYGVHDVLISEEIAGRAAVSLEHGRLLSEALDAVRARDEFLSIAAHELRTPLTALLLRIQLVRSALESHPEAKSLLAGVANADKQARRLALLVDSLLDVSRAVAGKLSITPESVDLVEIVRDVLATMGPELSAAGCELSFDAPPSAIGTWDRTRIEQLVTNLVSNAVKFGKGRPVEVRIEATEGHARLSVRDHGIGISEEDQARVFDRFERAVSARHFGGLGLGLYISTLIARAHGGTIRVQSEPERGSCFIVELPRQL
jgi:PAS domain S-box-containing protein